MKHSMTYTVAVVAAVCVYLNASAEQAKKSSGSTTSAPLPKASLPKGESVKPMPDLETLDKDMPVEEKVRRLVGERVTLLPIRRFKEDVFLRNQPDLVIQTGRNAAWNPAAVLAEDEYAHRSGTIREIATVEHPFRAVEPNYPWYKSGILRALIELEDGRQIVAFKGSLRYLRFESEVEFTKSLVGHAMWARWPTEFASRCDAGAGEWHSREKFTVPVLDRVRLARVEVGDTVERKMVVYFKTDDGKEGCLPESSYALNRFRIDDYSYAPATYTERFYTHDVRAKHPGWSQDVWTLIKKGEVAVGMTRDMAELACRGTMAPVGFILSESGSSTSILQCDGWGNKFIIANGKVTKYVTK